MPTVFTVDGPIEVPFYQGRAGRSISGENVREFWERNPAVGDRVGVYVFGVRAGRGLSPGYVGKTTRAFKDEVFQSHKLVKYQRFLTDYQKGTPVLFFIVAPQRRGRRNTAHIRELENFLKQTGYAANPELLNFQGTRADEWGIGGVIRGGARRPSAAVRAFKRMMKF